jgi:hypothetical protein
MKKPNSKRIKAAKAMALVHVNEQRASVGLPRTTRINKLWWSLYGEEWLQKLQWHYDEMKAKNAKPPRSTSPFARAWDATRTAEEAQRGEKE